MPTKKPDTDGPGPGLDAYFEAARRAPPEPTAALLTRIAADAELSLAAQARPRAASRPGRWRRSTGRIGRRAAKGASLAAALGAGLWIGVYPPATAPTQLSRLWDADAAELAHLVDPLTAYDLAWSGE